MSRGPDETRNHAFPKVMRPTVFLASEELLTPSAAQRAEGVGAISAADFRWLRCDLKTVSLLANCLLRQKAVEAGCTETIPAARRLHSPKARLQAYSSCANGMLLCAARATHAAGHHLRRDPELAQEHAMPHEVREILEDELRSADEIWMSSSTKEILPITWLMIARSGDGRPGSSRSVAYACYQDFKNTVMRGE